MRECFEETGILLAKGKDGKLLELREKDVEVGRNGVHSREVKFGEWVERRGGSPDLGMFPPFPFLPS